jgi:hypothetical protein
LLGAIPPRFFSSFKKKKPVAFTRTLHRHFFRNGVIVSWPLFAIAIVTAPHSFVR